MLEVTNRLGEEMNTLTEQALLAVYRAQQEHAWHENFIEDVESALERAGLRARSGLPRRSASSTTPATRDSPRNAATRPPPSWRRACQGWCGSGPSGSGARSCGGWETA
jgi:hypothetical protein